MTIERRYRLLKSSIETSALGTGTADSSKFLRGDGTWSNSLTGLGEVMRLSTTAARGTGQDYLAFNDPTGQKGYIGYGGSGDDDLSLVNNLNAQLKFYTNAILRITLSGAGNLTVNAPASGTGLTINGVSGAKALSVVGAGGGQTMLIDSAASYNYVTWARVGVALGDIGSGDAVVTSGGTGDFGITSRAGALVLGTNTITRVTISNAGNVTISAPASGDGLNIACTTGIGAMVQAASETIRMFSTNSAPYLSFYKSNNTNRIGYLQMQTAVSGYLVVEENIPLEFRTNNSIRMTIAAGGAITINNALGVNNASPPAQVTGWGTPTGAAVVANFPGATATLVQCSNVIAKLITDLKAFGLYAA